MPEFTDREVKLMAAAFQSMEAWPNLDYPKMASIAGYTNPGSVRNAMAPLKKKLFGNSAATPARSAPSTPKKSPKKTTTSALSLADTGIATPPRHGLDMASHLPEEDLLFTAFRAFPPSAMMPKNSNKAAKRSSKQLEEAEDTEEIVLSRSPRKKRAVSLIKRELFEDTSTEASGDSFDDPPYVDEVVDRVV